MPKKQNLRIMNINCRSVKENKSEFKVAVDYIKPDIICGTESWLKGYKPGKTPTSGAIKTSEMFPDSYNVFQNDRGTLGVGVFIAVQNNISAVECVDFITGCEIEYAKITLKSKKTLYIDQLESSLNLLNGSKPKQLILGGDFNCPDIDWETLTVSKDPSVQDRNIHQRLIDLTSEHNLTQIDDQPTRNGKLLDLVFTTNPSLIKSSVSVPGISDHDIVVTDVDIKPVYSSQKPKNVYKWNKANWDNIKSDCEMLSNQVSEQVKSDTDIGNLWNIFKCGIHKSVEKNVPSKMCKNKYNLPWVNKNLKLSLKTKARLHRQAKKSGKWDRYRSFQRECNKQFRHAEWNHINSVIQEGLDNKNSKPFWKQC